MTTEYQKSKFRVGDIVVNNIVVSSNAEKYYAVVISINKNNLELELVQNYMCISRGFRWRTLIDIANEDLELFLDNSKNKLSVEDTISIMNIVNI